MISIRMPASYTIDKERRLVISTGWDRLTFADFKAQQDELTNNPDFDPSFDQLVDVSRVTELAISVDEAKIIARRAIYLPTSRRAVVATNAAVFGMARLMDAYHAISTGRTEVAVFHNREEALQWLNR